MTIINTKLYRKVEVCGTDDNGAVIEITSDVTGSSQAAKFDASELAQLREALKVPSSAEFYDSEGDKWRLVDGRLHLISHDGTYRGLDHPWDETVETYGPLVPVQSVDTKYVVALDLGYLAVPGVADDLEDAAMFDTEEQARTAVRERERQVMDMGGTVTYAQIHEARGTYQGRWIV